MSVRIGIGVYIEVIIDQAKSNKILSNELDQCMLVVPTYNGILHSLKTFSTFCKEI